MIRSILAFFSDPWNILGAMGQMLFAARFIVQWVKSEMVGRSIIPLAFWYCSLGGGIVLLAYTIYREEPVLVAGQVAGLVVYSRNLFLVFRERGVAKRQHDVETPKRKR